MIGSDKSQLEMNVRNKNKIAIVFYILALLLSVAAIIVLRVGSFIENLSRLGNSQVYVSFSGWDIPAFIGVPCFLVLIYLLFLKLIDRDTEHRTQKSLKIAIAFAITAIVVRIPYGFLISEYIEHKGYFPCPYYSSPSLMSPQIWVRDPKYCIPNTGSIRKPLLTWLDSLSESNQTITADEVEKKAKKFLLIRDQKEREKYPELFK